MAKCLLGVLFILSAVLKFISIDAFERYLFSFTLFSFNFCSFAAPGCHDLHNSPSCRLAFDGGIDYNGY